MNLAIQEREGRPLSILLAEDNAANADVVTTLLEPAGHRITRVYNGKQAVDLVGAEVFDLILMGLEMPEMDGFQATAAIRAAELSHIPTYALTSRADLGDRCMSAGMDGHISNTDST